MKTLLKIALVFIPLVSFGADKQSPKSHLNPVDFSVKRQNCNLVVAVVSYVPTWRDNQVPVTQVHRNVEDILVKVGAAEKDKVAWHQAVDQLYGSKVTTKDVNGELRPMCEKIP